MTDHQTETGVVQAIMERLEQQTLPQALDIKRNVDAGEPLGELDTIFLDQALQDLRRDSAYVQSHPQWEPLYSRLIDLYDQITRQALKNETRSDG
jgi:hypothetical protein